MDVIRYLPIKERKLKIVLFACIVFGVVSAIVGEWLISMLFIALGAMIFTIGSSLKEKE